MAVNYIPEGYHTVTPYLIVRGANQLIGFMRDVFGAQETFRMEDGGLIRHAEVRIGDSVIMLSDGVEEHPPMPSMIHLYVPDSDATYRRALDAGATSLQEPTDMFYGDRSGAVRDPFGNNWWIATHVEDVSPEEMERRQRVAAEART